MDKFDFLYKLVNERVDHIHENRDGVSKYNVELDLFTLQNLLESAQMLYGAQEKAKGSPYFDPTLKFGVPIPNKDFYSAEGL